MKTIVTIALLTLSTVLRAQIGAKADAISVPEFGGAKVLHHCTVVEVQTDGVKVTHDDGISTVAVQFLPAKFQKVVQAHKAAEVAALKKEFADAFKGGQNAASAEPVSSEAPFAANDEQAPTAAAEGGGSTSEEASLMARRHPSKENNDHAAPSSDRPATINYRLSPPRVYPRARIPLFPVPYPYPYYVPWPVPTFPAPQYIGPAADWDF